MMSLNLYEYSIIAVGYIACLGLGVGYGWYLHIKFTNKEGGEKQNNNWE
jgi:hypothetical protein